MKKLAKRKYELTVDFLTLTESWPATHQELPDTHQELELAFHLA
jgi:hypothetical protein